MAKNTYKYNPETLTFEKHELSWKQKFLRAFGFLNIAMVLAVAFGVLLWYFYPSPREKELEREMALQTEQMDFLESRQQKYLKVIDELAKKSNDFHVAMFDQEPPIVESVWNMGVGGVDRYKHLENLPKGELLKKISTRSDDIHRKLVVLSKSFDNLATLITNKEDFLASIPAMMPITNEDLTRFSSGFGMRLHPMLKIWKMHAGVDFTAPTGTDIYSSGNGVVEKAKYTSGGFGKHVIIDHGYGYKTIYAHMSEIKVRRGQKITRGQLIGLVGNTGRSTGPHLHYEVVKNGKKVDPINYFYKDLSPEDYETILNLAKQSNKSFD